MGLKEQGASGWTHNKYLQVHTETLVCTLQILVAECFSETCSWVQKDLVAECFSETCNWVQKGNLCWEMQVHVCDFSDYKKALEGQYESQGVCISFSTRTDESNSQPAKLSSFSLSATPRGRLWGWCHGQSQWALRMAPSASWKTGGVCECVLSMQKWK